MTTTETTLRARIETLKESIDQHHGAIASAVELLTEAEAALAALEAQCQPRT